METKIRCSWCNMEFALVEFADMFDSKAGKFYFDTRRCGFYFKQKYFKDLEVRA